MRLIFKQFKHLLITAAFLPAFVIVSAQVRHQQINQKLKEFNRLCDEADVTFMVPPGFKETRVVNNEDFSFDYAIRLPDDDFEIWFEVRSEKENYASYLKAKNSNKQLANPDSLYLETGRAQASAFTGDHNFAVKTLSPEVLARYNADAGKSYMLTILDLPETRHYKYALLVTLQKDHTGTIMAICFTNVRDAEFFKKMKRAADCVKFKADKS